jgi:Leucine-rich repeat (LRR) protein
MSKTTIISVIAAIFILFFASQVVDRPENTDVQPENDTPVATDVSTIEDGADNPDIPASPAPSGRQIEVYNGIRVPENSTTLDLSGRGLTGSLKAEVRMLTQLRELNLSGNQFTGLPAEVGQLRELRVLNLSGNPFTGLPYELGNLQNLELLDLRNTDYAPADLERIQASLPASTQILK